MNDMLKRDEKMRRELAAQLRQTALFLETVVPGGCEAVNSVGHPACPDPQGHAEQARLFLRSLVDERDSTLTVFGYLDGLRASLTGSEPHAAVKVMLEQGHNHPVGVPSIMKGLPS